MVAIIKKTEVKQSPVGAADRVDSFYWHELFRNGKLGPADHGFNTFGGAKRSILRRDKKATIHYEYGKPLKRILICDNGNTVGRRPYGV